MYSTFEKVHKVTIIKNNRIHSIFGIYVGSRFENWRKVQTTRHSEEGDFIYQNQQYKDCVLQQFCILLVNLYIAISY